VRIIPLFPIIENSIRSRRRDLEKKERKKEKLTTRRFLNSLLHVRLLVMMLPMKKIFEPLNKFFLVVMSFPFVLQSLFCCTLKCGRGRKLRLIPQLLVIRIHLLTILIIPRTRLRFKSCWLCSPCFFCSLLVHQSWLCRLSFPILTGHYFV